MRLRGLVILMFRGWFQYVSMHRDVNDHPPKTRIRTQTMWIRNNSPLIHLLKTFPSKSIIPAHKGIRKLGSSNRDAKRLSKTGACPSLTQSLRGMTHRPISTSDKISRILHALK
jgi:hypothetical protein